MITRVISSAARLSLAPARLAGRIGGSLLREVRGNGAADAGSAPSSARAKSAARMRVKAQPKRTAARTGAKTQPKRSAARTRAKAQPKRPSTRTRVNARPKRAPRSKPLDDVTIARKVESTIFRGIDVEKGKVDVNVADRVAWLRGEVSTQDLINELEARTARVAEVRRVENLLHLAKAPAPGRTDTAVLQPETGGSARRPEDRAVMPDETSEEASPPESGPGTRNFEAGGKGRGPAPVGGAAGAPDSAAGSPDGDESAGQEGSGVAELDRDREGDEPAGQEKPDVAELDRDREGDEPAGRHGSGVAELDRDREGDEPAGQEKPDVAELDRDREGDEPAGRHGSDVAELDRDRESDEPAGQEGPDVVRLDKDPASYQPSDPGPRGLKGV